MGSVGLAWGVRNGPGVSLSHWAALERDELLGEIIRHGFEREQLRAGVWGCTFRAPAKEGL